MSGGCCSSQLSVIKKCALSLVWTPVGNENAAASLPGRFLASRRGLQKLKDETKTGRWGCWRRGQRWFFFLRALLCCLSACKFMLILSVLLLTSLPGSCQEMSPNISMFLGDQQNLEVSLLSWVLLVFRAVGCLDVFAPVLFWYLDVPCSPPVPSLHCSVPSCLPLPFIAFFFFCKKTSIQRQISFT